MDMLEIYKAILIFCAGFSACACANLFLVDRGNRRLSALQAGLIMLLTLPAMSAYFSLLELDRFGALHRISQSLTWMYGPLLYLTFRLVLQLAVSWKQIVAHLLFPLAMLAVRALELNFVFAEVGYLTLMLGYLAGYLAVSFYLLKQYKLRIQRLVQGHAKNTYYWQLFLLLGLVFLMAYDLVLITLFRQGVIQDTWFISLIASGLCVLASSVSLLSLFQPNTKVDEIMVSVEHSEPSETEHRAIQLSPEAASMLHTQLDEMMINESLFMDENLSLDSLSQKLGISRYLLSELLNVHMKVSFYEYLNELRYQEAVKLLRNPEVNLSISDIAYRAGFNSRNSFYQVFKLKTAMTPGEFRKQAAKAS